MKQKARQYVAPSGTQMTSIRRLSFAPAWPLPLCPPAGTPDAVVQKLNADLRKAMQNAETSHMNKGKVRKLQSMAPSLEQSAAAASPTDAARLHALAELLKHLSA